jgi:hypothetical protein
MLLLALLSLSLVCLALAVARPPQPVVSFLFLNVIHLELTDFNSYFVTRLTQYFGYLLSCLEFALSYQRYNECTNMYHIHKYMFYYSTQE